MMACSFPLIAIFTWFKWVFMALSTFVMVPRTWAPFLSSMVTVSCLSCWRNFSSLVLATGSGIEKMLSGWSWTFKFWAELALSEAGNPSFVATVLQFGFWLSWYKIDNSLLIRTGWYLVVLGQYGAVLVGTWWYWVSITWYCLVSSGTGLKKGFYASINWKN